MVPMVPQEEQQSRYSGGSDGTCSSKSSKKNKQKRIPQRGLGVAQLEKLRLEEQQKNAVTTIPANPGLHLLPPHQPSVPFLTAKHPSPLPGHVVDSTTPLFKPSIPTSPTAMNPSLWNSVEASPHDGFHAPLQSNISRPPTPSWGSSVVLQWRRQQQQQQPPPMSMVGKSLSPSSSGSSLQTEPPSNQNYNSNYSMSSSWPEEDRSLV